MISVPSLVPRDNTRLRAKPITPEQELQYQSSCFGTDSHPLRLVPPIRSLSLSDPVLRPLLPSLHIPTPTPHAIVLPTLYRLSPHLRLWVL
ncbi:hypothetical protein VKT23_006276 [Stygiomarasmius scandens]|uniref:Uncharacterized protein n=1 Tax=Marasmiellus scandens TaxID=2682957 RepID=A0ABR1JRZ3_9AGAR